jgi:hypothetical protein
MAGSKEDGIAKAIAAEQRLVEQQHANVAEEPDKYEKCHATAARHRSSAPHKHRSRHNDHQT